MTAKPAHSGWRLLAVRHSFLWCTLRTSYCTECGGIPSSLSAVPVAIEVVPAISDIHCNAMTFVGIIDSIVPGSFSPLSVRGELLSPPDPAGDPAVGVVVQAVVEVELAAVAAVVVVIVVVASPELRVHFAGTLPHIAGPDNIGSFAVGTIAAEGIRIVHRMVAAVLDILELPARHDHDDMQ